MAYPSVRGQGRTTEKSYRETGAKSNPGTGIFVFLLYPAADPLTRETRVVTIPLTSYETVEAEIKAAMPSQRVRGDENRAGNKPPNGPRRAQSKAASRVFCDVGAYVSCREYESIPQSARETVKQGGTANEIRP